MLGVLSWWLGDGNWRFRQQGGGSLQSYLWGMFEGLFDFAISGFHLLLEMQTNGEDLVLCSLGSDSR